MLCVARLATAVGVNGLPYGELYDELVGGMFELHWDKEHEAFFDHGKHMADGEVIKEAIMRCQQGAINCCLSVFVAACGVRSCCRRRDLTAELFFSVGSF